MHSPTALQAEAASQFLALGIRLPLRIDDRNARVIVDADGRAVAMALPSNSAPTDARLAVLLAMLPNIAAGISEPAEPHHAQAAE